MNKQLAIGMTFALVTALVGCGGGSSAADTTPTPMPPGTTAAAVAGPLDAVQTPVTTQIMGPLAAAVAGTPLQGVIICANRIVVVDALDGIDSVALAIQATDPTALASAATAANLQNQLQNMTVNLSGLLAAMKGDATGCTTVSAPTGGNPLAGTPLASVGDQLAPVLAQINAAVTGAGTGSRPALPLATLVVLYSQLNSAVQSALAQVPVSVSGAPVLGGAIIAVKTAMNQLNLVVIAAAGNNATSTQTVIAAGVNAILRSVLLGIVPVSAVETQAGHAGVLSTPIGNGVDSITALLGGGVLDSLQPATLQALLTNTAASILNPEQSAILAKITGPLTAALAGVSAPGNDPLAPLTTALAAFMAGSPMPLALITSPIEQIVALGGACPTAGTPLAVLCSLHLGLPL